MAEESLVRSYQDSVMQLNGRPLERGDFLGEQIVMMTSDMVAKLRRSLVHHEDLKHFPYVDTKGKITIGIGYNLTDRGMPDDWINKQYNADVEYFYNQLHENFPWFVNLNSDRQIVLVDMCFMGWKRFLEFGNMITALSESNWEKAADEMLNSLWAEEVKGRSTELATGMKTGVYTI
jgi:lysozyme